MSIFDIFKKKSNNDFQPSLSSLKKNEIVIKTDENSEAILPGASKIGGKPLLPKDFVWPVFKGKEDDAARPLSFLCQIDLAHVKQYDRDDLLPDKGMLYFFYELESFRWGFDPEDKGCARVFYFENTEDFVPVEWPDDIEEEYIVPEIAVRFKTGDSYPGYEELSLRSAIDCKWDEYDELLEKTGADIDAEDHKLLGYANIIQNEMLTDCERVSRGLYCGNPESYEETPEDIAADIEECAKDWILLLQLSTLEKDDWEWMWGDCGMLYFYIKKQDLAEKRFDEAWFSLQCG